MPASNGHDVEESPYAEWDQEEKTPVEAHTLQRLIRAAVRRQTRPALFIAVATLAAVIAFGVALLVTQ